MPFKAVLRLLGARVSASVPTFRYATHILLQQLQCRYSSVLMLCPCACSSQAAEPSTKTLAA